MTAIYAEAEVTTAEGIWVWFRFCKIWLAELYIYLYKLLLVSYCFFGWIDCECENS